MKIIVRFAIVQSMCMMFSLTAADAPAVQAGNDTPTLKSLEVGLAAVWNGLQSLRDEYAAKRVGCAAEWKKKREEIVKQARDETESKAEYAARLKKETDEAVIAEKKTIEEIVAAEQKAMSGKFLPACRETAARASELAEASASWELGPMDGEKKTFPIRGEVKLLALKFNGIIGLAGGDTQATNLNVTSRYAAKEYTLRVPFEVLPSGGRFELRPEEIKIVAPGEEGALWSAAVIRSGTGWVSVSDGMITKMGGIDMVLVGGGTFLMGKDGTSEYNPPPHRVKVHAFYIGRTEVTQAQWKAVMGNNPSKTPGSALPVEKVNWFNAVDFCNKLSLKAGLHPAYRRTGNTVMCDWNVDGFRLPTEAEWEFAARGGRKSKGYLYSGGNDPDTVAWYCDNSQFKTHPVGTKVPNELGIYDMSGNVWEWCWDWHGLKYDPESVITDPRGPSSGVERTGRGGDWIIKEPRIGDDHGNYEPGSSEAMSGFRLAASLPP